jgi:Acetyltransferase (GNAT) domain
MNLPSGLMPACAVPVNPLDHPGWDDLVANHPESSFFHGTAWARVLQDTYGHVPAYFCQSSNGRLDGLIPVMEVCSPWTGRRGVALPFTDLCPPLKSADPPLGELFNQALEYGRSRRWKYLECRGGVSQWPGASPSLTFHGHILDLTVGEAALFAATEPAVRRGIRKSERAGLRVRFGNSLDSVRDFFELHCQTRRRHGLPPQPYRFFENIGRHVILPGLGWVISVEQHGRPLAAAIFFHFRQQAFYKFGASDFEFQGLRPNNLLMWEAIKWYAAHGFEALHLGRTALSHEGLRRFKLGFGAREEQIEYCRYDFSSSRFVTVVDRVDGWFNPVFRALPQSLLRFAGSRLYPHLS